MDEELKAAEAEFASGYDQPTETPVVSTPEVKEARQPEPTPAPAAKDGEQPTAAPTPAPEPADPLKDVLARLDKYQSSHDKIAGTVGRLMQGFEQMQTTLAAAKTATGKVGDAPSKQQIDNAVADPAEWASLKSQYPQWAMATEKLLDARMPKFDSEAFAAEFEQKVNAAIDGKSSAMKGEIIDAALNAVVPGWKKEVNSDTFKAWIEAQPDDIKALAGSSDVGDAARMLKLYDAHRSAPKPTPAPSKAPDPKPEDTPRGKRLAAAVAPRGTGGHATGNSADDDFLAGYNG